MKGIRQQISSFGSWKGGTAGTSASRIPGPPTAQPQRPPVQGLAVPCLAVGAWLARVWVTWTAVDRPLWTGLMALDRHCWRCWHTPANFNFQEIQAARRSDEEKPTVDCLLAVGVPSSTPCPPNSLAGGVVPVNQYQAIVPLDWRAVFVVNCHAVPDCGCIEHAVDH